VVLVGGSFGDDSHQVMLADFQLLSSIAVIEHRDLAVSRRELAFELLQVLSFTWEILFPLQHTLIMVYQPNIARRIDTKGPLSSSIYIKLK